MSVSLFIYYFYLPFSRPLLFSRTYFCLFSVSLLLLIFSSFNSPFLAYSPLSYLLFSFYLPIFLYIFFSSVTFPCPCSSFLMLICSSFLPFSLPLLFCPPYFCLCLPPSIKIFFLPLLSLASSLISYLLLPLFSLPPSIYILFLPSLFLASSFLSTLLPFPALSFHFLFQGGSRLKVRGQDSFPDFVLPREFKECDPRENRETAFFPPPAWSWRAWVMLFLLRGSEVTLSLPLAVVTEGRPLRSDIFPITDLLYWVSSIIYSWIPLALIPLPLFLCLLQVCEQEIKRWW